MDIQLVTLIETDGDFFGDAASVWMPMTPEAQAEYDDLYFIDSPPWKHVGCQYLGTVGQVRRAIEKMMEVKNG